MAMAIAIALHTLAAVIWVGGMFFAYVALRPVAARVLPPPQRLPLWAGTLGHFFLWVWISVATLLVTGYFMLFGVFGGFAGARIHVHLMHLLGLVMMLIYAHVYFAGYRRLRRHSEAGELEPAGRALGQIRKLVGVNLVLGLLTVVIGSAGRYL